MKQIAYLDIRRRRTKRPMQYEGQPVVEVVQLRLCKREAGKYISLGALPRLLVVRSEPQSSPEVPPRHRALAWKELAGWVEHLAVFSDPAVVAGQYENRLKWEGWERSLAGKPTAKDLYDWQRDEQTLARLRPQYEKLRDKLATLIGPPHTQDIDALYPNEYDDVGYSDDARKAIKELRAVLGTDFVVTVGRVHTFTSI